MSARRGVPRPGTAGGRRRPLSSGPGTVAVSAGGVLLADRVQRADTFATRLLGRMGRPPLTGGEGLWLSRCGSVHTWFCRGAMDLIFLDADDRVLRVVAALRPWRMAGCRGARQVVELAPGRAAAAPGQLLEASPPSCTASCPASSSASSLFSSPGSAPVSSPASPPASSPASAPASSLASSPASSPAPSPAERPGGTPPARPPATEAPPAPPARRA